MCDRQTDRQFVEKFRIDNEDRDYDLNIGVECKGTVSISGYLGGVFRTKKLTVIIHHSFVRFHR